MFCIDVGKTLPGYLTVIVLPDRKKTLSAEQMTCCHLGHSQLESVTTTELLLIVSKEGMYCSTVTALLGDKGRRSLPIFSGGYSQQKQQQRAWFLLWFGAGTSAALAPLVALHQQLEVRHTQMVGCIYSLFITMVQLGYPCVFRLNIIHCFQSQLWGFMKLPKLTQALLAEIKFTHNLFATERKFWRPNETSTDRRAATLWDSQVVKYWHFGWGRFLLRENRTWKSLQSHSEVMLSIDFVS